METHEQAIEWAYTRPPHPANTQSRGPKSPLSQIAVKQLEIEETVNRAHLTCCEVMQ